MARQPPRTNQASHFIHSVTCAPGNGFANKKFNCPAKHSNATDSVSFAVFVPYFGAWLTGAAQEVSTVCQRHGTSGRKRKKGRSRAAFLLCLQCFLLRFGPQVCFSWDEKGGKLGAGDAVSLRRYAGTVPRGNKLPARQSAVCRPKYKSRSKIRDTSSNDS